MLENDLDPTHIVRTNAQEGFATQISLIEKLPRLAPIQKAWLLMIRSEIRPAATIQIQKAHDSHVRHMEHVLKECHFNYVGFRDKHNTLWIDVATKKEAAVKLQRLRTSGGLWGIDEGPAREYAQLLGYPRSAIEYFIQQRGTAVTSQKNVRMLVQEGELTPQEGAFVFFMPSHPAVQEEIEFIQKCHDSIKEVSPKIYAALVQGV